MKRLELVGLRKSFGAIDIIKGVDLDVAVGEFVVFVGPSGCGKSTLLRMIAGLEETTSGDILIDGRPAAQASPAERGVAMVFQSYALYPHMTVYNNMAFGLKFTGLPRAEIRSRVRRAAEILRLDTLLDRMPRQLSGGQRQRVAIGRAITREPRLFLFDEPLSNLDAALRVATRIEIANLKAQLPQTTMIYVTHDQVEALTLADRIVVMNAGRVEQVGTPLELYHRPANLFVAGFIGSPAMNLLDVGTATGLAAATRAPTPTRTIGIRPEDLARAEGQGALAGRVTYVERLGDVTNCFVDVGAEKPLIWKTSGYDTVNADDRVALSPVGDRVHFFGADGQRLPGPPQPVH